jgi:hypothetical protein
MTKSGYINAAFRSSRNNEAYFFINDKVLLLDYAPGTSNDKILYGPAFVRHGFPSLDNTKFGSNGIDCAFDIDDNEAFVFYQGLCAKIEYVPHTDKDKIISGPMKIAEMFPFLEGTGFEHGIDAAFRSTLNKEVYLFRGDKYARIDYGTNKLSGTSIADLLVSKTRSLKRGSMRLLLLISRMKLTFSKEITLCVSLLHQEDQMTTLWGV